MSGQVSQSMVWRLEYRGHTRSEGMEKRKLPGKRNLSDISVTSYVAEIVLSDVSHISLDAHSNPGMVVLFSLYI